MKPSAHQDIRVLIVEDETLAAEMIRVLLEPGGYTIAGRAVDGPQAIEMAQSLRPDVVLMDIGLPGMNGLEATQRIYEVCPTPVVVITAYETPDLVEQAGAVGVGAYLIKPPRANELERAITIAMARFGDLVTLRRLNAELQTEIAERKQAEERIQREAARTEALARAAARLNAQLDLQTVLETICEEAVRALGFSAASVVLCDGVNDGIHHTARYGWPSQGARAQCTVVTVEIMREGRLIGHLIVNTFDQTRDIGEDEKAMLAGLAAEAAQAIANAQLFERITQQREQLRALAARLAEAEEAERRRLARELHDQVGQTLTALGLNLNMVRSQLAPDAVAFVRARLDDSVSLVEQTTERVRGVMADLRPPVLDDYGLLAALCWYGAQFSTRTGIAVAVQGTESMARLATPVESALFRIAQEALTNVAKHAQATQVRVSLELDEIVRLVVADDGVGFDPARRSVERDSWGLLSVIERAESVGGHCRIESQPGQGARIIVEVAR